MKTAVIYARVSSAEQEQEGFSIPSQIKALRSLAKQYNCKVVNEFVESASARKAGRKQFNEMLAYTKANPVDVMFCYKPDRLARNHKDIIEVKELIYNKNVELVFYEGGRLDKSPQGMLLLEVLISVASFQVENQALDISRGLYEKVKQGYWPLEAPIGYRNDRNTRTVEINEETCFYVRQVFELYSKGNESFRNISRKLYDLGFRNKRGNRVWGSGIETILKNPFYYGMMRYKGVLYPGKHRPLISRELFDKVQIMCDVKYKTKKIVTKKFALRGFFTCSECGCSITAEVKKGYTYYRCTKSKGKCSQPYIREEVLEKEVENILEELEMEQELIDIIIESVKETDDDEIKRIETTRKSLETRLNQVKRSQKELVRKNLAGKISDELYSELTNEFEEDRFMIEQQLNKLAHNDSSTFELIEQELNKAKSARQDFIDGDSKDKHEILKMIASNMVIANREIVSYQLKEPFEMISKWPKSYDSENLWRITGSNR